MLGTTTTTVRTRLTVVAYHRWTNAPHPRRYLADRHRHELTIGAEVEVDHPDRAVEFHDLQEAIGSALLEHDLGAVQTLMIPPTFEFGDLSCEAIGAAVAEGLDQRWPGAVREVTVSEDQQCTAVLRFAAGGAA